MPRAYQRPARKPEFAAFVYVIQYYAVVLVAWMHLAIMVDVKEIKACIAFPHIKVEYFPIGEEMVVVYHL